jgi:hypothetical protein
VLLRYHGSNGYLIAPHWYVVCIWSFLYSNEVQNLPIGNTSVRCVLNNLCFKKKASFVCVFVCVCVVVAVVHMCVPPIVHLYKSVTKLGGRIMPLEITLFR